MSVDHQKRHAILQMVREQVALDPDFQSEVIAAATSGMKAAIKASEARRSELERAWLSALLMLTANRLSPGLKEMLGRSLVPVLERYGLKNECQVVRDAHAAITRADGGGE